MERDELHRQMERMRGQLDEMRGKFEQMTGREATGRAREVTGRTREMMAEVPTERPFTTWGLGTLAFLGIATLGFAIFYPRTFRRWLDRFFDMAGF